MIIQKVMPAWQDVALNSLGGGMMWRTWLTEANSTRTPVTRCSPPRAPVVPLDCDNMVSPTQHSWLGLGHQFDARSTRCPDNSGGISLFGRFHHCLMHHRLNSVLYTLILHLPNHIYSNNQNNSPYSLALQARHFTYLI